MHKLSDNHKLSKHKIINKLSRNPAIDCSSCYHFGFLNIIIMISDKTFQLAKNIGFDLKTCNCGGFPECICYEEKPTKGVLQKWLREKHNYHTEIYCHNEGEKVLWNYTVYTISNNSFSLKGNDYYSTYEFALENALIHLIKIISTQSCSQAE